MSRKKSEAAKINGSRSKGPTSEGGKARVRLNALKNGLFSRELVIPAAGERQEDFEKITTQVWEHFQPENVVEEMLAAELVENWWRRQRVRRCESAEVRRSILESIANAEYRQTLEVQSLKNRFNALLAEKNGALGNMGLARTPNQVWSELDEVRMQLESSTSGLSFLIATVSGIMKEAESMGKISDPYMGLLVACCGLGNEAAEYVVVINSTIRKKDQAKTTSGVEVNSTKSGEQTDEATDRIALQVAISLIIDKWAVQMKVLQASEKIDDQLRHLAAALPGSDALNRISRAEAAIDRRFYKALLLLLAIKKSGEIPRLLT